VSEELQLPRAARVFISFVALLRANSFSVAPEQTTAFLAAIELLGPRNLEHIRQAGIATLAPPPERRATYDRLFDLHFRGSEAIQRAEGADEEIVRNTNSAFVHLHEQMGYFSWAYMAGMCLFMGFLFEFLASLGKTIFLLPCGAILYASAELWRLDLFHQGIFIVWMVVGIGLPSIVIAYRRLFSFVKSEPLRVQGQ